MRHLRLVLVDGTTVRTPSDTALVALPEDERPLRGDAGQLDWRIGGEISRLLLSGYLTGQRDEAALLPGGAMIGAGRVLLYGVGKGVDLAGRNLTRAFRAVTARLLGLRTATVALALPAAIEVALDADDLLWGLVSGLAAAPDRSRLSVLVPHGRQCGLALERAVGARSAEARHRSVMLELDWQEAS